MTTKVQETVRPLLKDTFNVRETLGQISINKSIFWSWGVHNLVNMEDKGLLFRVNGHHHKGWVLITLDWSDTYDVYLISTHGNMIKEFHMVYCDMIMELIDEHIEKIKDYQF